jgi:hypothetical protein
MKFTRKQKNILILLFTGAFLVVIAILFFVFRNFDNEEYIKLNNIQKEAESENRENLTSFWHEKNGRFVQVKGNKIWSGWITQYETLKYNDSIESSLFSSGIEAYVVDTSNDRAKSIFVYSSSDESNIREAWIFKDTVELKLISPLMSKKGEQLSARDIRFVLPDQVTNPLRVLFDGYGIWLRDIDNKKDNFGIKSMEIITLDQAKEDEDFFVKKVFKLKDNFYELAEEKKIGKDSNEFQEIMSWEQIKEISN